MKILTKSFFFRKTAWNSYDLKLEDSPKDLIKTFVFNKTPKGI